MGVAPRAKPLLFAITIFLSAFLLFSVEPLLGKRVVPWFGGSAAVWSTCLVFFQAALLLGYFYARSVTKLPRARTQAAVHVVFLTLSLASLPIGPGTRWSGAGASSDPSLVLLGMLALSAGLPFAILSATSPLLQHWLAWDGWAPPYWLFAVSNLASFVALLGYPTLIEPSFDMEKQRFLWSIVYGLFTVLCAACALRSGGFGESSEAVQATANLPAGSGSNPRWKWFALSACGSMLLLSVTNHIDENVAAVPLLWVLPLAVYLITFVIAFGSMTVYRPGLFLRLLAFALGVLGYAIYNINEVDPIQMIVPVFLGGLFICCLFCHGELNRLRPAAAGLTSFYLVVAAGGAAGALLIGLVAPRVFSGVYELPLTLVITAGLALFLSWESGGWPLRVLWAAVIICMGAVLAQNVGAYREGTLALRRSFYGSLRVVQSPRAGPEQTRTMFHGTIQHGSEYLLLPRRKRPTTYYGPESGIGIVLRECFSGPKRVGIVGLGTGTIAAYGHAGDVFRFYEINHQVVELANSLFFYLRETPARVDVVEGDARLSLERESGPVFDVLALDAFSGDAIPVHLLTREAMALYQRRVKPEGVIAVHVSNNYLNLGPVVRQLADGMGYRSISIRNHGDPEETILPADWILVTKNMAVLGNTTIEARGESIPERTGLKPWTDGYNNLLEILKTPPLK